jgi:hypothetical protein
MEIITRETTFSVIQFPAGISEREGENVKKLPEGSFQRKWVKSTV